MSPNGSHKRAHAWKTWSLVIIWLSVPSLLVVCCCQARWAPNPFQLYFERQTMKVFVVLLFNISKQYFSVCLKVFERIIFVSSHVHCVMFHTPVIYPLIGSWFSVFKEKKNAFKQFQMPPGGLRLSLPRLVPICFQ